MRTLTLTLTAALIVLGMIATAASAQTQASGATSFLAQLRNMTPIARPAACTGRTGYCGCGPGWVSACRSRCCRCVPC